MSDHMNRLYARLTAAVLSLKDREEGQGMAEYGLILVLVALACVLAFTSLGTTLATKIGEVVTGLS
jgi:pilus assembly protein Flp/PilA